MSERVEKVNELIMRYAAEAIHEIIGPSAGMITVTRVETSPDLRHSKVWVSVVSQDSDAAMARLLESRREIQLAISPKFAMKYTPRLEFLRDDSGSYVQQMERLFRKIGEK